MANEYRVTSFALETMYTVVPNGRVTAFGVEVMYNVEPPARVTSFGIEVMRSVAVVTADRRRQIVAG